jgi:hypothetical protein
VPRPNPDFVRFSLNLCKVGINFEGNRSILSVFSASVNNRMVNIICFQF